MVRKGKLRLAATTAVSETTFWALDKSGIPDTLETAIWDVGDWDIAIVLDATRLDLFQQAAKGYDWLPNYPDHIWSVGSMSPEWIGETFRPERRNDWQNAGYVTANPFSCKSNDRAAGSPPGALPLKSDDLAYLDEVWRDQWQRDPVSTVTPEVMADRALYAWENHDMDRLVVHMMQPHIPFRSRPEWFGHRENLHVFGEPDDEPGEGKDVWKELRDGERSRSDVWAAYLDNLHWGLDAVNYIRERTNATIAITSDHGNSLGEFGVWSHPPNNPSPYLRKVPFVEIDGINELDWHNKVPGTPPVTDDDANNKIDVQLKALGYMD